MHFTPYTMNCPLLTPIYDKWRSLKKCKLRHGKLQSVFTTHSVIDPIDHSQQYHACFKLARVQPYWSLHSARSIQRGPFNCGMHGNVAPKLSPRDIFFICTFSIFTISHDRRQMWTIYGLWRKMRYQNLDKKIFQRFVIIMSPYNIRIENSGPSYNFGPSLFGICTSITWRMCFRT